jgi:two-component system, NtrC family, response regulator AtoC
MKLLMNYAWPGNVRELKNVIERAMILEDEGMIEVSHLAIRLSDPTAGELLPASAGEYLVKLPREGAGLEDIEKQLIQQALEMAHGNKTRASKLLKLSRDTLRYKVKKYGLE